MPRTSGAITTARGTWRKGFTRKRGPLTHAHEHRGAVRVAALADGAGGTAASGLGRHRGLGLGRGGAGGAGDGRRCGDGRRLGLRSGQAQSHGGRGEKQQDELHDVDGLRLRSIHRQRRKVVSRE
ncbi:hypothetical protein VFPFJ_10679 [Purpureocillium lilacinum]|uniref:Uncharacterized protein n=1 Tax=Purpureocillium lilacinum TaxID=33203 RepID=A0A179GSC6_PURLI|nr:hypothetical protein VFPFJ_10679 [Purpureocillium lilacinum]OAQ75915.1 hypothetical protein VFPFJ_10679 [Purpureocillium lilacinum]OAQ80672.1 hypothetical protein VFPBJ_06257 [Purpureocillium lilacinum]